ncbi:MAG: LysR family transcriptional regulator [Clostridiales bacterium]|nr:LysR family transcriptional regulator [Clostridiales bacterium]
MELNYLRDFVVLADTCQFQEAAEQLYISQSSLSKHIKTIEQEFGKKLFDRSTRKVELTRFGRAFLPYAQRIVETQTEYINLLLPELAEKADVISIGISPLISCYSVSDMLAAFTRGDSGYPVHLFEEEDASLLDMLRRGKCSAIISAVNQILKLDYSGLITVPLFDDTLTAVLPEHHPLAGRTSVSVADLSNDNYIQLGCKYESDPALGVPVAYASSVSMAVDFVKRGLGVSIICKDAALNHPKEGVVYVDMEYSPKLQVCMMYSKKQMSSPEVRALVSYFQSFQCEKQTEPKKTPEKAPSPPQP